MFQLEFPGVKVLCLKNVFNVNINRYIAFPELLSSKIQSSVTLRKFHAMFLDVDFMSILSFNFLVFSHRKTRINSFKRDTIKFT